MSTFDQISRTLSPEQTVRISLVVPDSPFEYPPCASEPTFFSPNNKPSHTFKVASLDWSASPTRNCKPQNNLFTVEIEFFPPH